MGVDWMGNGRRLRWRTLLRSVLVCGLAATAVVALPDEFGAAAESGAVVRSEAADAVSKARATGSKVELVGRRTATTEEFANPDGTFTTDVHARPVRVKKLDGGWAPIDLTLRRTAGTGVVPTASPTRVRFSGGGDGPVATVFRDGATLSFTWPRRLPTPVLRGDTATYPDVLPGVDLALRAYPEGFAEALVVKSAEAARNPELRVVRFTVATSGVALRLTKAGGFTATDASGTEVFGSGTPTMWDSGGRFDGTVDAPEDARGDRLSGPAAGARRSVMPTRLVGQSLELTTDQAMLSDPNTAYPVYIDPSTTVNLDYWTMINATYPGQSYWSYDRSSGAKVGYVYDSYKGENEKYRSLFRFSTSAFKAKHVLGAEFSATLYHSYSCTKSRADLYRVATGFSSSTDWNSSTPWESQYNLASAYGQSCTTTSDLRMEWASSALTTTVDGVTGDYLVLGLRAADEATINAGWKKFTPSSVKLSVTYNTPPDAPSQITVGGRECASGASRPVVNSLSPKITAYLRDPDTADSLDVRVYWAPLGGTVSTTDSLLMQNQPNNAVMTIAEGTGIPEGELENGKTYFIRMYARDRSTAADRSADSPDCEFTVDMSAPPAPTITPVDAEADFGLGIARTLTFGANGATDVRKFEYWINSQAVRTVVPDAAGNATVKVTPNVRELNVLHLRSTDAAGNIAYRDDYFIDIGSVPGPVGYYPMSEPDGTRTLTDGTGSGNDFDLSSAGSSRVDGRVGVGADRAVRFTGAMGFGLRSGAIVDTSRNFTLSAWARLTDKSANRAVLSISQPSSPSDPGSAPAGFTVGYDKAADRWVFERRDATTAWTAASTTVPRADQWTHLAGTFDLETNRLYLYVNGNLEGYVGITPTAITSFTAIGQAGGPTNVSKMWVGDVDDVRFWNRRTFAADLQPIANQVTMVGEWLFEDDPTSTIALDTSGYGHDARFTGAVTRTPGYGGTDGLALTGGHLTTDRSIMLTDQSMTVSAWVRSTDRSRTRTALCQTGAHSCSFYLQYFNGTGQWAFSSAAADTDGTTATRAYATTAPTDSWTHLVGVYDAVAKQLRIYINGSLEGTVTATAPWNSTGAMQIGLGRWNSASTDNWLGDVDQVRVFTGVLSQAQILDLRDL